MIIITKTIFLTLLHAVIMLPLLGANAKSQVKCLDREMDALLRFKAEVIQDYYGTLSSWKNKTNCCSWKGIQCDNVTNHVVALDISRSPSLSFNSRSPRLSFNRISPSLLDLIDLKYLDLSRNNFNGSQIPEFIGSLHKLKYLNLNFAELGGLIPPSLGNLSLLQSLVLDGNNLHSNLDWLSGLQSLKYLDLYNVNLSGAPATWLDVVTELPNIKEVHLGSCELPSVVLTSHSLRNSSDSLVVLDINNNNLSISSVSPWAINISSNLDELTLSGNTFTWGILTALNLRSVSNLRISDNGLKGSIPETLGILVHLSYLDLSNNEIEGEFPDLLLKLTNLTNLRLSGNNLTGPLPNMSRFQNLKELRLAGNFLNGSIEEDSLRLPNLEFLALGSNQFEGFISEAHLFNLPMLKSLDLYLSPNLTFRISSSWEPPFQLFALNLAYCKVGPQFPTWLQSQTKIQFLDISDANIFDRIPNWFLDHTSSMTWLDMSDNRIHGTFFYTSTPIFGSNQYNSSSSMCDWSSFSYLDLSNNMLSGDIPTRCFQMLMNSSHVNLGNNNFSGKIPNSLHVKHSPLEVLNLQNNSFTGYLPRSLQKCGYLKHLNLRGNKFYGNIPRWLGETTPNLVVLSLKSNHFNGSLPSSICYLTNIQVLDISINMISGTIPKCFDNFTILSTNSNYSSISTSLRGSGVFSRNIILLDFSSVSVIWKGMDVEYLKNLGLLKIIDLSCNNLIGEIPHEITSLEGLFALNLSRNGLIGSIPHDINRLGLLNVLDLSKNNLSGNIPSTLSQLSHLGFLNLSFNNLSGKIPTDTHMSTFGVSSYEGNLGLCGPPLISKPCKDDLIPKKPKHSDGVDDEEHWNMFKSRDFYISLICGFIFTFWAVFWPLYFNRRWNIALVKMFTSVEDWLYVRRRVSVASH